MRVIFMGTPDFAVGTLEEIIKAGHEVALVVSQPDKAVGRSKALRYTPVKACALEHGIEVYQPQKVRDSECIERLRTYHPDIIIVEAFGQIIPRAILDMPRYGCVNVHASLLPKYRGAAPIQWAVINGDAVTGVTTMRMRTMEAIYAGTATYTPQDNSQATHTAKIYKEMGSIDWKQGAKEIECLIRGLDPWPSAYTRLGDKMLKIWKAQVVSEESGAEPGCIVKVEKDHILVQTGKGMLAISELQLEGKKRMPVEAFLNGYEIEEGTYFKKG